MSETHDRVDELEVAQMRSGQRRRVIWRLAVGFVLAIAGVWAVSRWTSGRVQVDGLEALARGHRDYVEGLRVGLPRAWSIERVVAAHALAHTIGAGKSPAGAIGDACMTIRNAQFDASGDEPDAPCHGLDLAWGDCALQRRGPRRESTINFAQGLRTCEATLSERLTAAGRPMLSFDLDGEPLPLIPEPLRLPSRSPLYDRVGQPLVVPTEQDTVLVEFIEVPCDQPEPESMCLRHLVYRLTDEGLSAPAQIDPSDSVYRWWRVHPLTNGTIVVSGRAPEDRLVIGHFDPSGSLKTTAIEGGGTPQTIIPLANAAAIVRGRSAAWLVHSDLRVEPAPDPLPDSVFRSAGPSDSPHEPWREDHVAAVGGGFRLHLRWVDDLLVAERRAADATTTAVADRSVVLWGRHHCWSQANAGGRVVVLCRHGDHHRVVTSNDGGRTWLGERGP